MLLLRMRTYDDAMCAAFDAISNNVHPTSRSQRALLVPASYIDRYHVSRVYPSTGML